MLTNYWLRSSLKFYSPRIKSDKTSKITFSKSISQSQMAIRWKKGERSNSSRTWHPVLPAYSTHLMTKTTIRGYFAHISSCKRPKRYLRWPCRERSPRHNAWSYSRKSALISNSKKRKRKRSSRRFWLIQRRTTSSRPSTGSLAWRSSSKMKSYRTQSPVNTCKLWKSVCMASSTPLRTWSNCQDCASGSLTQYSKLLISRPCSRI